jgi:hypothetical protein
LFSHLLRRVVAREQDRYSRFERGSGPKEPPDAPVMI